MKGTTYAMIPARKGSQRLKFKNLALIDGEPMISHAIQAATNSGVFDNVIVNSDAEVFGEIAAEFGAEFYHRPSKLGSSDTKSDEVIADFVRAKNCDTVAWVNPISPLQPAREIKQVIQYFEERDLDSLFTVKEEMVHSLYQGDPINFSSDGLFAKTQELDPVYPFVYSVMVWDTDQFLKEYKSNGHAFFCGETGFYPVSDESGLIVKTKSDLQLADAVMRGRSEQSDAVEYHDLIEQLQ